MSKWNLAQLPDEERKQVELVLPAGTLRISGKLSPKLLRILISEMQGGCR